LKKKIETDKQKIETDRNGAQKRKPLGELQVNQISNMAKPTEEDEMPDVKGKERIIKEGI